MSFTRRQKERLETFDRTAYNTAVDQLADAEKRRRDATEAVFAGDALPGFLSDEWRAFIEAGDRYIASLGLEDYPTETGACT